MVDVGCVWGCGGGVEGEERSVLSFHSCRIVTYNLFFYVIEQCYLNKEEDKYQNQLRKSTYGGGGGGLVGREVGRGGEHNKKPYSTVHKYTTCVFGTISIVENPPQRHVLYTT